MRSETKRITGAALIELRRAMIDSPDKSDGLVEILIGQIESLKYAPTYKTNFKRMTRLSEEARNAWAKVDHLKAQMYKMVKGYEKKIVKLEKDLEEVTETLFENTPIQ